MRLLPTTLSAAGMLLVSLTCSASTRPHHHTSTHAFMRHTEVARAHHSAEHASFVSISPERATEIQGALIQKGYLSGAPTGTWDAATVGAMQKLQEDNGWQTKLVPDSRALIKLGLGPGSSPAPLDPGTAVAPTATTATTVASSSLPADR